MRKHWQGTSFDWQYEALLAMERTRAASEAHRQRTHANRKAWAITALVWLVCLAMLAGLTLVLWGGK